MNYLLVILSLLFLLPPDLEARGGHHGGGHHKGGHHGRGPSMSRSRGQGHHKTHHANRERHHMRSYFHDHPVDRSRDRNIDRIDYAGRRNFGDHVRRNAWRDRSNLNHAFNRDFWGRHHYHPSYWNGHGNWWGWGTAAGVGAWLGWSAAPVYYGYYGNGADAYYGPSAAFAPEPSTIEVTQNVLQGSSEGEWMSLGVFALTKPGETAASPTLYLQLALNKDGEISGTFYNAATDQAHAIDGDVDEQTQRVALQIGDNETSPVIETGIYNLTQGEAPVQMRFSDGTVQQMMLVRLDQPKA